MYGAGAAVVANVRLTPLPCAWEMHFLYHKSIHKAREVLWLPFFFSLGLLHDYKYTSPLGELDLGGWVRTAPVHHASV